MSSVKQTKKQSQMIMGGDPRRAKKSLSKKTEELTIFLTCIVILLWVSFVTT